MNVPISWLKDYVDIKVSGKEYADALTMSGSKVEGIERLGEEISNVVVGKIVALEKHPDADRLQVSQVDVGTGIIQVVTGAQNVRVGDYIPVALHGSTLPGGKKISRGKLRGVESNGMMCSIQELGLTKADYPNAAEDGIFILEGEQLQTGMDIKKYLGMDDTVVEFEITSNRPDCFSILGLARESAVTFGVPLKKPDIKVREDEDDAAKYATVEIQAPDLCPRYAARIVKNVKIGPSPDWMKQRLKACGVRPINNIVDITNYVMLELGQPMHAFDLNRLKGSKIIVRRAADGEKIRTLDDQDRTLDSSMLVIADAEEPVAVAGVMGGANSEISEETHTILFESANFDGISVRLAAKKLGMRTEASSRFEKGLDVENVITAVNRAAQLVAELGAGTVCKGIIDCYVRKPEKRRISLRPEKINAFLGTAVETGKMIEILRALEFDVNEKEMVVEVPSFRPDVEREADLAEEIARFYGYNNIIPTLLAGKAATLGRKTPEQKIKDRIKDVVISCGFCETYTYSFTSPKVFDSMNLPAGHPLRKAIVISNPLGEDFSIMRTTTLPDMLEVIRTNYSRRVEEARLFELSYVYLADGLPVTGLPHEKPVLTLGMYGNDDFYDVRGVVEELLSALGITEYEFAPENNHPSYHPGRTANLLIQGANAGVLGEIHPVVARKYEVPERSLIAMLDVEMLVKHTSMTSKYKPLPKFPAVTRDIAMLIRDEILVKQIEEVIRKKSGAILEKVKLFDVYKGKQVPEGMKSVAYSITFRAEDRTLTDDEVNSVMASIINGLRDTLGAQLRE